MLTASGVIAGTAAAAARQPRITARDIRIRVADGPRDSQREVLDATFFTRRAAGGSRRCCSRTVRGGTKAEARPEAEMLARAGFAETSR